MLIDRRRECGGIDSVRFAVLEGNIRRGEAEKNEARFSRLKRAIGVGR
ncbi:MAG: hypothetical protein HGB35_05720 [Geobacteraceae bacterium]|nr:hypothetical protein [Geobacteraceae bacterium]